MTIFTTFFCSNGHGAYLQQSRTPGFGTTNTVGGHLNLYNNGDHKVNVNAFKSHTKLHKRQIDSFDRYGGNVEYQHRNGHSASLGVQSIPQINQQTIDANAKVNLWRSNDQRTTFDWNTGASKNVGQFNRGQTNWNTGVGLTHRF